MDEMVKERVNHVEEIEILEMNELFTYVKQSQKELETQENLGVHIPGYGLLWIGADLKLLR